MNRTIEKTAGATGVVFTDEFRASDTMITVQLTGTWAATVQWEISNDGTNWVTTIPQAPGAGGAAGASTASANGMYIFMVQSKFFRANVTAYTSGTIGFNAAVGMGWIR